MKFTQWLAAMRSPKGGRHPQPENKVPFQEIMPLNLKDRVSGKHDRNQKGNCLFEMTLVMSCLKANDFENKFCKKEVNTFNQCYKNFLRDTWYAKRAQEKGLLVPGEKNFTRKQIRNLFRMYPNL